jgi:hypothetical protein
MKKQKHAGGRPKINLDDQLTIRCVIKFSKNQAKKMGSPDQARRKIRICANNFIKSECQ